MIYLLRGTLDSRSAGVSPDIKVFGHAAGLNAP